MLVYFNSDLHQGINIENNIFVSDLNFNLGFNENENESLVDKCNLEYGGFFPFSEPESLFIKQIYHQFNNIKISINLMYGESELFIPSLSLNCLEKGPNSEKIESKIYQKPIPSNCRTVSKIK